MKNLAIISEYNPFHIGHKYHIEKSKQLTGATHITAIMSGNFVQRGEPAINDKYIRARNAVINGCDLVIELPFIYATSSSEYFSRGAINILEKSNSIDYLSFGSESGNIDKLKKCASIKFYSKEIINDNFKKYSKRGLSYASAMQRAVSELSDFYPTKSNDILAVAYIERLLEINSKIKTITIKRKGADYNSLEKNTFPSAAFLREEIKKGIDISKYIAKVDKLSSQSKPVFLNQFKDMIFLSILRDNLNKILGCSEGLDMALINKLYSSNSIEELLGKVKTKRYALSRLKRLLIHILVRLDKSSFKKLNKTSYIKVLAFNNNGRDIIRKIKKNSDIQLVYSYNDRINNNEINKCIYFDKISSDIYALKQNKISINNYTRNLII